MRASRLFCLLPFAGILLGVGVVRWRQSGERIAPSDGQLKYPSAIELPPQRFGAHVVTAVEIYNTGATPIGLMHFEASCSCIDLRVEGQSEFSRADGVQVRANDSLKLLVGIRAAAPGGSRVTNLLRFRTSEPGGQQITIPITIEKVLRDAYTTPERISFGTRRCSEYVATYILVHSDATRSKCVSVQCSDPAVKIKRNCSGDGPPDVGLLDYPILERIGIEIDSAVTRDVDTALSITVDSEQELHTVDVPITCRIANPVEFVPARLTLPRRTSTGPAYEGAVMIESSCGPIDGMRVCEQLPETLMVAIGDTLGANRRLLVVSSRVPLTAEPIRGHVKVLVDVCGKSHEVLLPVTVQGGRS